MAYSFAESSVPTAYLRMEKSSCRSDRSLIDRLLVPTLELSSRWLNHLHFSWTSSTDPTDNVYLGVPSSRTKLRVLRHGFNGAAVGHLVAASSHSNVMPNNLNGTISGSPGLIPFTSDGLESYTSANSLECRSSAATSFSISTYAAPTSATTSNSRYELLRVAPGMSSSIASLQAAGTEAVQDDSLAWIQDFETPRETLMQSDTSQVLIPAVHQDPFDNAQFQSKSKPITGEHDSSEFADVDAILPREFPTIEMHRALPSRISHRQKDWAHVVDVSKDITNFRSLVPTMAKEWPFELDTFQKEAIYHLENGDSVFIAAHTSAGKTVVAEYAIALAAKHMTKAIYTSPIKALSNQKYRDFKQTFPDVGILTGDVQINPEASCLIMTTEILRSMLYRGADMIRDVEFVIFDEVHYVNDLERGVVWEEVIIMLPDHVSLILLSATVSNTFEFASWVGRTKKRDIYVISTAKRPVPLEHFIWAKDRMVKIVDANRKFLDESWKTANAAIRGQHRASAQAANTRTGNNSGSSARTGGGQVARRSTRPVSSTNRSHGTQDRMLWLHLVKYLQQNSLLPVCIFVFSKKKCEFNADSLSRQDFCTSSQKSHILMLIKKSIARLKPDDRNLPQILRIRELLCRGIAVHHGGLLPIVKELVEILFAKSLIKVLFATETFAMGLNLPTRTVCFAGYRKHDGHGFRNLLPGEYTQMAGRAGRRGLDPVGSAVIIPVGMDEAPPVADLQKMVLGEASKLRSQFRLTYNMILNLLRVEALKIEEMIKRSFSEHATQQLLPQHEKGVVSAIAQLASLRREDCSICDEHMDSCHEAIMEHRALTEELYRGLISLPISRKYFCQGRLIVFRNNGVRSVGILLRDETSRPVGSASEPVLYVCEITMRREVRDPTDILPYVQEMRSLYTPLLQSRRSLQLKPWPIALRDVECLTRHVAKGVISEGMSRGARNSEELQIAVQKLLKFCESWESDIWGELDLCKIKSMRLVELKTKRLETTTKFLHSSALQCPNFLRHFTLYHEQWIVKERISELKQQLSDQNLQLLPDYEQRLQVLKDLGFVGDSSSSRIQLKGKVACEVHSGDELVLTELILENVLRNYEPAEIAALLSAFVFHEKTQIMPKLTDNLTQGCAKIIEISKKVNDVQMAHQVTDRDEADDFEAGGRFGLVEVVYEWARGMSFRNIMDLTDVMEGTIVRVITRLDETCREVKSAARIIGDPDLFQKMQTTQELIRRDVTAVASLYV